MGEEDPVQPAAECRARAEVEVRQFFEIEDFPNAPAEVVEQERKHFGRK